jgi:hypothetical protein
LFFPFLLVTQARRGAAGHQRELEGEWRMALGTASRPSVLEITDEGNLHLVCDYYVSGPEFSFYPPVACNTHNFGGKRKSIAFLQMGKLRLREIKSF